MLNVLLRGLLGRVYLFPEGDAPAAAAAPATGAAAPAAVGADPPPAAAAQPAAAQTPKPDGSLIAPAPDGAAAKDPAAKPDAPPAFDPVAAKAFLTEKGAKAADLDKLDAAALEKQFTEAKAAADAAAKVIEFKAPEGIEIPEEQAKAFKEILEDAKLSPSERAQKLVDMHGAALRAATEAVSKSNLDLWNKTQADWQAEFKADKELGGANTDAAKAQMTKAVMAVMGKDSQSVFDAMLLTGAGNNPAICRLVYRLGALVTESGSNVNGSPNPKAGDLKATLGAMYPSATPPT